MIKLLLTRVTALQPAAAVASATLTRLVLGWVFIESGWGKLHSLDKVTAFFADLGIPAPQLQAPLVAGMEFVCGGAILLGILTRLASVPIIFMMLVAIATAKRGDLGGVSDLFGFIEFLYIAMAIQLIAYGPGPLSIDRFLKRHWGPPHPAEETRPI